MRKKVERGYLSKSGMTHEPTIEKYVYSTVVATMYGVQFTDTPQP